MQAEHCTRTHRSRQSPNAYHRWYWAYIFWMSLLPQVVWKHLRYEPASWLPWRLVWSCLKLFLILRKKRKMCNYVNLLQLEKSWIWFYSGGINASLYIMLKAVDDISMKPLGSSTRNMKSTLWFIVSLFIVVIAFDFSCAVVHFLKTRSFWEF